MNTKNSEKDKIRDTVISVLYAFELEDGTLNLDLILNSENYSEKVKSFIKKIMNNYKMYKKMIQLKLKKGWNWNRISPLIRALLVYGSFEMNFSDKAFVINWILDYAKEYIPNENYKFINPILESIGNYYETIKKN